jgi:hypothetical protein
MSDRGDMDLRSRPRDGRWPREPRRRAHAERAIPAPQADRSRRPTLEELRARYPYLARSDAAPVAMVDPDVSALASNSLEISPDALTLLKMDEPK